MTSVSPRNTRLHTHRHLISTVVGALALYLAVPSAAFAASIAKSSVPSRAVVAHHDGGIDNSNVGVSGMIVSLGNGSIVVQDGSGFWRTIVLGLTTTYSEGPMAVVPAVSANNLAVGSDIIANGVVDANHTSLDATSVRIELVTAYGTVQSISPSSALVSTGPGPSTKTIDLTPQTVVFSHSAIVALSTVSQGSVVEAFGLLQSDGSILALYLGVDTTHHGFGQQSAFGFTLPNRFGPHHYIGHSSK